MAKQSRLAALREAKEEIGLDIQLTEQFQVYSDPARDARQHTISIVFLAIAQGQPQAGDDAKNFALFTLDQLPANLCFDHDRILSDYRRYRETGERPQHQGYRHQG